MESHQLNNFEKVEDIDKAIESLSMVAKRYEKVPNISRPYNKKINELMEYKKARLNIEN